MKKLKLFPVFIAFIVILTGCGAQSAAISAAPLPSDDGATELTVEVFDFFDFYANAALKFETLTGVKVNVINHYNAPQSNEDQDYAYLDRIPSELMAGKGADIYANLDFDFTRIGQQGHLCNLANWIAADPDFSDETYYMNILESGFDDGDVYSFPLTLMFGALGSYIEIPELDGKNLNWEEFFEATKDVNRNGVLISLTDNQIFMKRFEERFDSFIDEENKMQNLESSELIELLEQSKTWSEQGLCIKNIEENYADVFQNAFIKNWGGDVAMLTNTILTDSLSLASFSDDKPLDNSSQESEPTFIEIDSASYFYDMPSDLKKDDKSNQVIETDPICINAASPRKGTAWAFVKFLLSKEVQATSYFLPVSREAAGNSIRNTFSNEIRPDRDVDKVIEETQAILNSINDIPNRTKTGLKEIISKEATRYFTNEISAQSAAKNMAAAIELYLREQ